MVVTDERHFDVHSPAAQPQRAYHFSVAEGGYSAAAWAGEISAFLGGRDSDAIINEGSCLP